MAELVDARDLKPFVAVWIGNLSRFEHSLDMPAKSPDNDPFNLARFISAQDKVYADVLAEWEAGAKRTHWMCWFIFPQVAGLGHRSNAKYYAGFGEPKDEAEAYFAHPVLGGRLRKCTQMVLELSKSAHQIFGSPDDLKFRSFAYTF